MYLVTDIAALETVLDGAAPRPMKEVILEYYPDCTIDRNGRAHAPYDGYECQFTGAQFRAGEYLPFEPNEEIIERSGGSFVPKLVVMTQDGEVLAYEGSKGQIRAGREEAKAQMAAYDETAARHVGEVGKRQDFVLTLMTSFVDYDGLYGPSVTYYFRDADMNPVVWKTSKSLGVKVGEVITLKATVKAHWTARGGSRVGTYVTRGKVL